MQKRINIIGGGLAGSEAALYLANKGFEVHLYDIKGEKFTPAHHNPNYAEIVCSNSFKSDDPTSASGILKQEQRKNVFSVLASKFLQILIVRVISLFLGYFFFSFFALKVKRKRSNNQKK